MAANRVRKSLRELEYNYKHGDTAPLNNLIRAFRAIQKREPNYDLPPEEDLSFFRIAGFHGEPFEGPGRYDSAWWGGYCHHSDVLFPAWHRAYLLHLENALRSVPGCEDVTLPFWDETWDVLNETTGTPIPTILTTPEFPLPGDDDTHNPLYSYRLAKALAENVTGNNPHRYSKHKGYETVRYPLSGLVGTEADKKNTKIHNEDARWASSDQRTTILNDNVNAWIKGTVEIDKSRDDPSKMRYPDTYSVLSRYQACLKAPTYTSFSNNESMKHYQKVHSSEPRDIAALESPHNAMHLAVGGFYQENIYNANPIYGANGDMGDNETAGFDPIFFLHHCFVDYVFWLWQKKHGLTAQSSLRIETDDPGARSPEGAIGYAPGAQLENTSPLAPFKYLDGKDEDGNDKWSWYTLDTITDIENQLGYKYGAGSLDPYADPHPPLSLFKDAPKGTFTKYKGTELVDRSKYAGSFVIRTYAVTPRRGRVEIGREPVLSRWNLKGCGTCQGRLMARGITPVSEELEKALLEGEDEGAKIEYHAHVERRAFPDGDGPLAGFPKLIQEHRIEVGDL
jgi:tyrosinase